MQPKTSNSYRFYVLVLLMTTYMFSYMDRQILSILIEDVGAEFALNDTQRGLLMGLAFALFYAGLGVPVAWLADRTNRRNIISVAVTVWSLATALCAATTGFWSLFAARIGVGIGEAGGAPPAHSILGDYFRKSELTRALSVYSLGPSLGAVLGLMGGGILADQFGWRNTFLIIGLPGVLLGLLVYFTIREPVRGQLSANAKAPTERPSLFSTIGSLMRNKPYMGALVAHTTQVVKGYVLISWSAAIMIRSFEATKTEVGMFLGLAILCSSPPGLLLGGYLADKLGHRDARWMAWVPAVALLFAIPFYTAAMFSSTALMMAVFIAAGGFFYSISFAPGLGIVQTVVEPHQRAQASAFVFLFANLFGLGLGPMVAGWISDALQPTYGIRSLNMSVATIQLVLIPASIVFFWTATRLKGRSIRD